MYGIAAIQKARDLGTFETYIGSLAGRYGRAAARAVLGTEALLLVALLSAALDQSVRQVVGWVSSGFLIAASLSLRCVAGDWSIERMQLLWEHGDSQTSSQSSNEAGSCRRAEFSSGYAQRQCWWRRRPSCGACKWRGRHSSVLQLLDPSLGRSELLTPGRGFATVRVVSTNSAKSSERSSWSDAHRPFASSRPAPPPGGDRLVRTDALARRLEPQVARCGIAYQNRQVAVAQ